MSLSFSEKFLQDAININFQNFCWNSTQNMLNFGSHLKSAMVWDNCMLCHYLDNKYNMWSKFNDFVQVYYCMYSVIQ